MIKNCLVCNREYKTKPSHEKRRKYCSHKCFGINARGKPSWNTGKSGTYKLNIPSRKGICNNTGRTLFKPNDKRVVGKNNNNWKGGVTPLNQKIRHSKEYSIWRTAVFMRDNYSCVECGDNKGGNLEADHIKPFSTHPELRFAIDNGRTLCHECHQSTDTYGYRSIINKTI